MDIITDKVEFRLESIKELVQTRRENLLDLGIRKFSTQLSETLFRWVGEGC